jgi:hypothetical protein
MERPKWDLGSSLWRVPTYEVEEYVIFLHQKIADLTHYLDVLTRKLYIIEQKEKVKGGQKN